MAEEERRTLIVENPIVNNPFQEPTQFWLYTEGQPQLVHGRRPSGYYLAARTTTKIRPLAEEEFVEIETANQIRERVRQWRQQDYPGTTRITRELLNHWNNLEREGRKRLFFCEKEAAETIIWLTEAPPTAKQGITIPTDEPNDPVSIEKGYKGLKRYGCKMATGSGKTVVMAMLIAWSTLNKLQNKQDTRFTDAILVVCPNLTIKERLQVLQPSNPKNYYEEFDLVPRSLLTMLTKAKIVITNWQAFNPQDDTRTKSVMQRGEESDSAFCRRVLPDLRGKKNILVINDEAHHAYRPKQKEQEEKGQVIFTATGTVEQEELEEEYEEATVWINALDRINAAQNINFCIDTSATPFYIKGSGYQEGLPHPWIVSDFGLVDAIESGIVKIPRVPVDSNSGRYIPEYFELWKWINERLPYADRQTLRRRAKPEAVLREGEGALAMLASEWQKTLNHFQNNGVKIPPAMIVVCDNTNLSELVAEHISKGNILPELENIDEKENTLRIDTKLLNEAESQTEPSKSKKDKAELLRKKVATVGKEGELGEQIRCIVSVGMLNEGWDAQNITQILGLRAFTSQLLCEQVVGRGLRRTNYDDFTHPEYVDVYGIPFEVIPVAKKTQTLVEQQRLSTLVRALPERKHLEIKFPRVEGYILDVKQKIKADIDSMPRLIIDPTREPTEVVAKDFVGYRIGRPDRLGPGKEVIQDRNPFHSFHRLQTTAYHIAAEVTDKLGPEKRPFIFPQVLELTWQYIEKRVRVKPEAKLEDAALRKYMDAIISRLCDAIRPDTEAGEVPILPRIERYRPVGSSSEAMFRTVRECYGTAKSHVSHVVTDSRWEHSVAYQLERNPNVISYVKNDHLDFEIPYEFAGVTHGYRPDYIIRYKLNETKELNIILEVKGYESEQDRAKQTAAKRWIDAVNHHGGFGIWKLTVCRDPHRLNSMLESLTHD
jgi:type III restriction enzyme